MKSMAFHTKRSGRSSQRETERPHVAHHLCAVWFEATLLGENMEYNDISKIDVVNPGKQILKLVITLC